MGVLLDPGRCCGCDHQLVGILHSCRGGPPGDCSMSRGLHQAPGTPGTYFLPVVSLTPQGSRVCLSSCAAYACCPAGRPLLLTHFPSLHIHTSSPVRTVVPTAPPAAVEDTVCTVLPLLLLVHRILCAQYSHSTCWYTGYCVHSTPTAPATAQAPGGGMDVTTSWCVPCIPAEEVLRHKDHLTQYGVILDPLPPPRY